MADGVEAELEKHMQLLDIRARQVGESLAGLEPQIDRLRASLNDVEDILTGELEQAAQVCTVTSPKLSSFA